MAASPDHESVAQDEQLHELIAEYHREIGRSGAVDRDAFLRAHAEFRSELESYFQSVDSVERLAGPTQAATHGSSLADETMLTPSTGKAATANTPAINAPTANTPTDDRSTDSETHSQLGSDTIAATQIEDSRTEFRRPTGGAAGTLLDRFGRYRIVKELGRGAMGAVYLAHDEQLDLEVALKIPQFGGDVNSGMLERFYREARAAAALRHSGICPVFDVGEIDGQHYITMAYIKGRALRDFTKSSKRQKGKQVARVIRKIALAMAEAHEHNVVHRDLKPANVMIDERNEPVVMDFGLARRSVEGEERLTHTGTIIGTPAYMSPEQVDGDNDNVGPHSEIYSLGVIFYELLTGQLPFQGNLMSILKQISTTEPRPPVELHGYIDSALQNLCLQMLDVDPAIDVA